MRLTLEQLKAMSKEQLRARWTAAQFPFECIHEPGCGTCLTGHHERSEKCVIHEGLTRQVTALDPKQFNLSALLEHLEELYALRLFYDSLYPPAPSEASPASVEVAAHVESH